MTYQALKALSEADPVLSGTVDADLQDLLARGLLHHDQSAGRFDLHPIVRRFAYDRLTGGERDTAHGQLRIYFAAVPKPDQVKTLDDLAPVIELYHHTVRAGQYDEARTLFGDRLNNATFYQFGAYQLRIELLRALRLSSVVPLPVGRSGNPRPLPARRHNRDSPPRHQR